MADILGQVTNVDSSKHNFVHESRTFYVQLKSGSYGSGQWQAFPAYSHCHWCLSGTISDLFVLSFYSESWYLSCKEGLGFYLLSVHIDCYA